MKLKIKDKIFLIALGIIILTIVCITSFNLKEFIDIYRQVVIEKVFAQLTELRYMIKDVIDLGLDLGELTGLDDECVKLVRAIPYGKFCYIMNTEGKVLYHSNAQEIGLIYEDPFTKKALQSKKRLTQYIRLNARVKFYDFSLPIYDNADKRIGLIRLGIRASIIEEQIARLIKRSMTLGLIVIYLAWVAIFFLVKINISRPLNRLTMGIGRFTKGDFNYRVYLNTNDELTDLASAFNKMAEEIQKLMQSEKEITEQAQALAAAEKEKSVELANAYRKLEEMQDSLIQIEKFNATGKLASGIAHEVKNPLGVILANIEYIEIKTPEDAADQLKAIGAIKENIKRASKIINDLVVFSCTSKLALSNFDINDLIRGVLELVSHQCSHGDIHIDAVLGDNIPKLSLDVDKLQQVFINLFLNAIQAMPNGGTLSVRSYMAKMSDEMRSKSVQEASVVIGIGDDIVLVEVEDTGIGIAKGDLKRIFDPFFTTKPTGQGTGLGLPVSLNIVKMHEGEMSITSTKNVGTKIQIVFHLNKRIS